MTQTVIARDSTVTVSGPQPTELAGRQGLLYRVHAPAALTGRADVDERLTTYPVAVFLPPGRPAAETPLLLGLQGLAAPYQWNGFLVPCLLDRGIGCVLFDTPLAGERGLARRFDGDVLEELAALVERGVAVTAALANRLIKLTARDFGVVLRLVEERHGLTDPRRALFGVSMGAVLASYAFLAEGLGRRLLGAIGHADLRRFARSYAPLFLPVLASPPVRLLGQVVAAFQGPRVKAGLAFLGVLNELASRAGSTRSANPMRYAGQIGRGRRVRFLVGAEDPLVRPEDAVACARQLPPEGACYVVPGLAHGGERFMEHVGVFIATQLGDWGQHGEAVGQPPQGAFGP
jgi:hypothetical protein